MESGDMSTLNLVKPENAKNEVKETYDMLLNRVGEIPKPLELWSVSPDLLVHRRKLLEHYIASDLSTSLLAFIRYLSSISCESGVCATFNAGLLKAGGLTDRELELVNDSTDNAKLEDKEKKMLAFVMAAIKDPDFATQEKVDELRQLGWNDRQIFEATHQGADMLLVGKMMKIFRMG